MGGVSDMLGSSFGKCLGHVREFVHQTWGACLVGFREIFEGKQPAENQNKLISKTHMKIKFFVGRVVKPKHIEHEPIIKS